MSPENVSELRQHRRSWTYNPQKRLVGSAFALSYRLSLRSCKLLGVFVISPLPPMLFEPLQTAGSPLSTGITPSSRLRALGIESPHRGPHSLRHACAGHLMAERFSLKEVGDHLGHRSAYATRTYAKVDLAGLREVANFGLGGLS